MASFNVAVCLKLLIISNALLLSVWPTACIFDQ
jgi:hypothetical protein